MSDAIKELFVDALRDSWSLESSTKWTKDNPAAGQCGVSALVAQDILGGEILKTRYRDLWHFYNRIDNEAIDFTQSQFDSPIEYEDLTSNRKEAFTDTNTQQYDYLRQAVKERLSSI